MKQTHAVFIAMQLLLLQAVLPATANAGSLNVGMKSDIQGTEFSTKLDRATTMVLHHVLESLVAYNDDMVITPNLADSYEVSEDGRQYTFILRDDVLFHNGEKLTAQDVRWNFDRFMDPARDWGDHCREQIDGGFEEYIRPSYITGIEVKADNILQINLQSPSAVFLHHLASYHCLYGIAHPQSVNTETGEWAGPIGTGPYKLAEWRKGQSVTLEKNPAYRSTSAPMTGFAGKREAMADTIEFHVLPDDKTALKAFETGAVDILTDISPALEEKLKKKSDVQLVKQATPGMFAIVIQSRTDSMLRNPVLRQAISHAIDRDRIIKEALGGGLSANPSVVATGSPHYTHAHKQAMAYDVSKAKNLLQKAGYAGEPLEIFTSAEPYPLFATVAHSVAALLQEAGINAFVKVGTWTEHETTYASNTYQLTTLAFSPRTDPTFMYSSIVGQKGDHVWYVWEDQEAESLVTLSAIEDDAAKRQGYFDKLHRKMLEWAPIIPITDEPRVDAVRQGVSGYEGWTLAIPRFWGVEKSH